MKRCTESVGGQQCMLLHDHEGNHFARSEGGWHVWPVTVRDEPTWEELAKGAAAACGAAQAENAHLRKALLTLEQIAHGTLKPDGNEPEEICPIVEIMVRKRRDHAATRWWQSAQTRVDVLSHKLGICERYIDALRDDQSCPGKVAKLEQAEAAWMEIQDDG